MRELCPPQLNLKRLYGETLESEPVILIISAGADLSQELRELASQIVVREIFHEVVMAVLEEPAPGHSVAPPAGEGAQQYETQSQLQILVDC
ncbi:cytoplasmic dynein 2 heavy chain 1-like isoform X2 [Cyprinus carpio]|nr:cytoplasmic dynein 2 heavy chain 1-like isoform X2 [Cyprinus carpio]